MRVPFVMECGVFKTSYRADMEIHRTPIAKLRWTLVLVFLFTLPLWFSAYWVSVVNLILIASIASIGLNILTGYTGQISIGTGAFLGVGAYASAYFTTKMGIPFWIALPLAGLTTALVGAFFGLPSLRLKGLYLAIATLAAQVIIEFVIIRWESVTGGVRGILVERPSLFGYVLGGEKDFYYLNLLLTLGAAIFADNLFRTRPGRAFMAVRDRDIAAELLGVNLFATKMAAFALSSFYIGVAGSLWGHYSLIVGPEHFTVMTSIWYLAAIIIGGLGSVVGSVFGAAFMTLLPIGLRMVVDLFRPVYPALANKFASLQLMLFGLVIVLFLIVEPEGLAKLWRNVKDYFKVWPFAY